MVVFLGVLDAFDENIRHKYSICSRTMSVIGRQRREGEVTIRLRQRKRRRSQLLSEGEVTVRRRRSKRRHRQLLSKRQEFWLVLISALLLGSAWVSWTASMAYQTTSKGGITIPDLAPVIVVPEADPGFATRDSSEKIAVPLPNGAAADEETEIKH
jgi:hypothetical protein